MKLTLTMYADDVDAMLEALDSLRDRIESGATVGRGATDEWSMVFDIVDTAGME